MANKGRKKGRGFGRLMALARERELAGELGKLENCFGDWRAGRLGTFELNDRIHVYHDGVSRELWVRYVRGKPHQSVAYAVAKGVLTRDEVPSHVLSELSSSIAFYEDREDAWEVESDGRVGDEAGPEQ